MRLSASRRRSVGPSANAQQARRIYLFEGLAPWQPGGAASLDAFRQRLKEKSPVDHELYVDHLDLGRFPGKAHEERLVRFLGEKFAQNPPHLLVPNGPGSLSLLVRHRDAIAPGVPIVYCCAAAEAVDALNLPRDVLGVILEYNWAETLMLAAQLQPGARNLVLVSGASQLDKIWRERALTNLAPHLQRYQVRTLFDMTYDDVLKELARLPRDTIVLQISIFADAAGRRFFQTSSPGASQPRPRPLSIPLCRLCSAAGPSAATCTALKTREPPLRTSRSKFSSAKIRRHRRARPGHRTSTWSMRMR